MNIKFYIYLSSATTLYNIYPPQYFPGTTIETKITEDLEKTKIEKFISSKHRKKETQFEEYCLHKACVTKLIGSHNSQSLETQVLTTLPRATTLRKVEGLLEDELEFESSTSSSASSAAAWRIESASWDNSSIASIDPN